MKVATRKEAVWEGGLSAHQGGSKRIPLRLAASHEGQCPLNLARAVVRLGPPPTRSNT